MVLGQSEAQTVKGDRQVCLGPLQVGEGDSQDPVEAFSGD